MDLKQIEVSPTEIADVLERYATGQTADDKAVRAACKALEEKRLLISLSKILTMGSSWPLIAVAPAWARVLHVRINRRASVRFFARKGIQRWTLEIPQGVSHGPSSAEPRYRRGFTLMPSIPPDIRPLVTKDALVLFEVDKWNARMPLDPALLKPVAGDLWEVVATWDLTELERLALAPRIGR